MINCNVKELNKNKKCIFSAKDSISLLKYFNIEIIFGVINKTILFILCENFNF